MDAIDTWIQSVADAWWVHLVVGALSLVDGFFPTVPSESVVVTLASLWSSSGRPSLVLLGLAAWAGACAGDNIAYAIGRTVGWERFRYFREGKGHRAVELARTGLRRRALLFIMSARYIPFGRTAVNLVAGAVRYPHRQFLGRSAAATFVWSLYCCAIGALAGSWFEHNRVLGIVVALVAAVVISLVLERTVTLIHGWLDRRAETRENAEAETSSTAPATAPSTAPEPSSSNASGTASSTAHATEPTERKP